MGWIVIAILIVILGFGMMQEKKFNTKFNSMETHVDNSISKKASKHNA